VDDFGQVRLWDIRTLKCIQQLSIGNKAKITRIIDISSEDQLAFLGTRLNLLSLQSTKKAQTDEGLWVIRAEFDITTNHFIVCTRRDVRILDSANGRVIKIFSALMEHPEDEIVCFRSLNQYKNFVIGDLRGKLSMYRYQNCECIERLTPHTNMVTQLKVDPENNILVSAGNDSRLLMQTLSKPF
jgi:WD40 repeat protein